MNNSALAKRIKDRIGVTQELADQFVHGMARGYGSQITGVRLVTEIESTSEAGHPQTVEHLAEVTKANRSDLLKQARDGDVLTLEFDAITYRQGPVPNRNFSRLAKKAISKTARSGKGSPFLTGHDWGDTRARGGHIVKSQSVKQGDETLIVQTVRVVTAWAVMGVLDGTIELFSVGWIGTGPVMCSQCKTEVLESCWHFPGDVLEEGQTVEWEWSAADLVETSSVNVPSVLGTGIDEVRAAVLAVSGTPTPPKRKHTIMSANLRQQLGLSADATDEQVSAEVAELKASAAGVADLNARVAAMEAQAAASKAASDAQVVESTITQLKAEGKMAAQTSPLETAAREIAVHGIERFTAFAQSLPVIFAAIGAPPQTHTKDPVGATTPAATNRHLPGVLKGLGLSAEQHAKYGPAPGARMMGRFERDKYAQDGSNF